MAVSKITSNSGNFLNSAANTDFNLGSDSFRYQDLLKTTTTGGKTGITISDDMMKSLMSGVNKDLSVMSGGNKSKINDIVLSNLDSKMGVGGGTIANRSNISNNLSTICGNFDCNLFNKYGNLGLDLNILGLLAMLAALICMGITNALSAIWGLATAAGTPIGAMVGVVGDTLTTLGFGYKSTGTNKALNGNFGATKSSSANTKINTGNILDDIVGSTAMTSAFRGTDTSKKLINGYRPTTNSNNISTYSDKLVPGWNKSSLSSSNASSSFLSLGKSTPISNVSNLNATSVSKSKIMSLFS